MNLFGMIVGIDVVLGPFLTIVVARPNKPRSELQRDIRTIVLLQLVALSYGMYTIALARPVHLVFEIDRFRVVSAADLDAGHLASAPVAYRNLPWTGPTIIAARKSATQEEMLRSLDLGLQGMDISMQPERWEEYAANTDAVLTRARRATLLVERYPHISRELQQIANGNGIPAEEVLFLPLQSRFNSAVALIAPRDAKVIGFLNVEGFF